MSLNTLQAALIPTGIEADGALEIETNRNKSPLNIYEDIIRLLKEIKRVKIITDTTIDSFDRQVELVKKIFEIENPDSQDDVLHLLGGIRENYYMLKYIGRKKMRDQDELEINGKVQIVIDYFERQAKDSRLKILNR